MNKAFFKWGWGGSRAAATAKLERFVIIDNGFQPLTIITKRFILDVAAAVDPPLYGLNPFHAAGLILYLLKILENQTSFYVFRR